MMKRRKKPPPAVRPVPQFLPSRGSGLQMMIDRRKRGAKERRETTGRAKGKRLAEQRRARWRWEIRANKWSRGGIFYLQKAIKSHCANKTDGKRPEGSADEKPTKEARK